MTTNINQIVRRTRRYWYDDGFLEIAQGVLFLVIAGLLWVQGLTSAGSFWFQILSIGVVLTAIVGTIVTHNFVATLKQRVTFPRTGYVAFQRETNRNRYWIVGATALAVAIVIIAGGRWLDNLPLVAALVLAAAFVTMGGRLGALRFYIPAALAVVLGAGVAMAGLSEGPALAVILGGMGLAEIIIGSVVLLRYFGQKPSSPEV